MKKRVTVDLLETLKNNYTKYETQRNTNHPMDKRLSKLHIVIPSQVTHRIGRAADPC